MFRPLAFALLPGLLLATSCATTPEPCTVEGAERAVERLTKDFVRSNFRDVSALRGLADNLSSEGGSIELGGTMLQAASVVLRLAEAFEDDLLPDARAYATRCGSGDNAEQLFRSVLREANLDDSAMIDLLTALAIDRFTER